LSAALLALVALPLRAQQSAPEPAILAVPGVTLTFSAGYIAEDQGFFARRGLQVKSVTIVGIGAINAVIAGSADFAEVSASSFGRAAARGQRLLAIVNTIDRPFVEVVLRNDLAAAAGFDPKAPLAQRGLALKGRTIAVDSINSMIHAYVRLVAARSGYDPDEIRIAPMQPDGMLAAFDTGQIDGFAISLPWTLKPVLDGKAAVIASGPNGDPADMKPFGHNIVVTRPETCAKRRSLCEKMGHAFADAIDFIQDHPQESLALLQKRFPQVEPRILAPAFAEMRQVTPNPPVVSQADIENAEIYNIDAKLLKPEEKLKSYDGLYTDDFVK
jgi:NitT/TauT family transport system substrate-binding protein